jgi:nucleolar protein 53
LAARATHIHSHIMAPAKSNRKYASASAVKPKKKSSAASVVGAPAQHNQSSRKGKKAWRKNVDIEDLEDKLEGLRDEERTFGCVFYLSTFFRPSSNVICRLALQKKTDSELFIVDTKGDDKGMHSRHSPSLTNHLT